MTAASATATSADLSPLDRGRLGLLGLAMLVALLAFDPGPPAYAVPKAALLVLLGALALPSLPTATRRPGTLLAVLAVLALGPLVALDPATALWGRSPRAEGLVFLLAILTLALTARALPAPAWPRLDRLLHLGGGLLALSVLAGVFHLPVPGLPVGIGGGHGGTLGNPNTAGAVLAALLVHASARGGRARAWLPLYAAALFGTGSRAAWLAMLVGLAWLLPSGLLRRTALGVLTAAALGGFALLSLRADPAPSAALRIELWASALHALAPTDRDADPLGRWRWLVGYGLEQQAEVLERHRHPTQNRWEADGHERVGDRAHSLPLDLWLSLGLAGLAALYWMLRRIRRAAADRQAEAAAALALLVAALVGFQGPAEWLLLAIWLARIGPEAAAAGPPARPGRPLLLGLLLAGVASVGLSSNPARRDQAQREALEADYRARSAADTTTRALAARACQRAVSRAHDGEAQLLCAQLALAAGATADASAAARRSTELRPARPRAWLLWLLADPSRAESAWPGFRRSLDGVSVDAATAAAWASALEQRSRAHPALAALPGWSELLARLRAPGPTP